MHQPKKKRPIIQSIYTGDGRRIYLPPRKKRPLKKKPLSLRFVITGTIPSKKNLQIATINKKRIIYLIKDFIHTRQSFGEFLEKFKAVKPFIRYSEKFIKWEDTVRVDLLEQAVRWWSSYQKHNLVFPISKASIAIYHYWKDDYTRDNSNKMETINDIFVKANILADDAWQNLHKIEAEANIYSGEILDHITVITLTAYDW